MNTSVIWNAPSNVMEFVRAIPHLLHHILCADMEWIPVFIYKVCLVGSYVRVCKWPYYISRLPFDIPHDPVDKEPIIGFRLSLQMGYIDSAPYFLLSIDMVPHLVKHIWITC